MGSYKFDDQVIICIWTEPSWPSMNSQTTSWLLLIHFGIHNGKVPYLRIHTGFQYENWSISTRSCLVTESILDSMMDNDALLSWLARLSKNALLILFWKLYIYNAASYLNVFKNIHNGFHYGRFLITLLIRRVSKNPLLFLCFGRRPIITSQIQIYIFDSIIEKAKLPSPRRSFSWILFWFHGSWS